MEAPFRWMRESHRHRLVKRMTRWFPRLFGCQHIMRASIQDTPNRPPDRGELHGARLLLEPTFRTSTGNS